MKLKALVASVALVAAGAAQAFGPGPLGVIDNLVVPLSASHSGGPAMDFYDFDVTAPGFAGGGVASVTGSLTVLAIGFMDSTDNVLGLDNDGSDGFFASATLLTGGAYRFVVVSTGDLGSYEAVVQTLIPVPEPETYALMLAGLAVVGWHARRRTGR